MKKRFAGLSIHASVLAFCAVLAMRFPHAVAAEPPPPPPPPPPAPAPQFTGTGSFQSRLVMLTDDGLLTRAYEAGIRERYADSGTLEADVRLALDSAIAGTPPYLDARIGDGEFEGTWEFVATPGTWPPARAWRDIDRSGDGYAAERVGYCRGSRKDCGKWFEAGRHHSRSPPIGASDRAEVEWANRVMEEPCQRGPEFKPPYGALQSAISSSGMEQAEVLLTALLNPCGDVRNVWVSKSSRNRDIDRAAIAWARGGRFVSVLQRLGTLGRRGTLGRLPFTFVAE